MDVSCKQNNNCRNFRSVNIIQVSKNAFKNTENAAAVSKSFIKASNKAAGEIHPGLSSILSLFGFGKKANKTLTYLEQPGYVRVTKAVKRFGENFVNAISRKTGVSSARPLMEDYHTFVVLTGEHKDKAISLASAKSNLSLINEISKGAAEKRVNGQLAKNEQEAWIALKSNELLNNRINSIIAGEDIHTFKINDLSELPETYKKIDY